MRVIDIKLTGYLVGNNWMPGCECYKHLVYSLTDQEARWSEPGTLREHLDRATMDGDFQNCRVADGLLTVTVEGHKGTLRYTRKRHFPLSMFPSVADYRDDDWAGPYGEEE